MIAQDKHIIMGDCMDKAAMVKLEMLSGSIYRVNSGHYLRLAGDSAVVQDWNDAWPWNQNWKIIKDVAELNTENTVASAKTKPTAPHIQRLGSQINLALGSEFKTGAVLRIFNSQGREIFTAPVTQNQVLDTQLWCAGVYTLVLQNASHTTVLRYAKF
jgi:hypothetical protein